MKLETLSLLLLLGGSTAALGCDIDLGDFGDGDTDADDDDDDDDDGDDGESESGGSSGSAEGGSGSSDDPSSGSTSDDGSADASSGGGSEGDDSSSGVCEAQTTDCDTCLDCAIDGGSCGVAFDACIENLECVELIGCYDECAFESDPDGCMVSCDGMHGGGVGDAEAFLSCATAECGTLCE